MTYTDTLALFFVLLLGIIVIPGMDMVFVMANAITGGRRLGFAATGGITAGGAVHTAFGAMGVGVLARWMPALLPIVLYAGAAYMAWIGISLVRSTITLGPVGRVALRRPSVVFVQGLTTCLLNPKAYLFVFSVYPQFLQPAFGPIWRQAIVLGLLTAVVQVGVYGAVAIGAARAGSAMATRPGLITWSARIAGVLFVVAAIALVLESRTAPPGP
ncbi:LysE family translocator [Mongoliimonas terrestris]|uniref:LysE family translocator n=1 Tax=Mongoliimonas terrestris TaxID=1709001 RepID=UPI00094985D8|nr:LysE family translocator [Mongoliimonas terrestris]